LSTRRRIYLLRHAEVAYFDEHGQPVAPDEVPLTPTGRRQAERAGTALAGVRLDRVLTSGLPRTVETARLVLAAATAPGGAPARLGAGDTGSRSAPAPGGAPALGHLRARTRGAPAQGHARAGAGRERPGAGRAVAGPA
jgi:hypothetical protein